MPTEDALRTAPEATLLEEYRRFAFSALGIVTLLAVAGWWPTLRWGGPTGPAAMAAGCGAGLVAAAVGTVPIALAKGRKGADTVPAVMGSIAARMMTAVLLGVLAAATGELDTTPLILWLVISHAGLLVADIQFARRVLYLGPHSIGPKG